MTKDVCSLMQSLEKKQDCYGNYTLSHGMPAICHTVSENDTFQLKNCHRYYRSAELKRNFPELWQDAGVCCQDLKRLLLECAEDSGYLKGALDIRKYPNDGKDVWRNYKRVKLAYCPFCGASQQDKSWSGVNV